jgi:hypothetical protein
LGASGREERKEISPRLLAAKERGELVKEDRPWKCRPSPPTTPPTCSSLSVVWGALPTAPWTSSFEGGGSVAVARERRVEEIVGEKRRWGREARVVVVVERRREEEVVTAVRKRSREAIGALWVVGSFGMDVVWGKGWGGKRSGLLTPLFAPRWPQPEDSSSAGSREGRKL